MSDRIVFHDLVGPVDPPTTQQSAWLERIARETQPSEHAIPMAQSCAATEPGAIVERTADGWRAGRYVGELRHGGQVLEVRPRLGIDTLAEWAAGALNLRVIPRAGEHGRTSVLIAELMAATWRSAIVEAARHGLPGFREDRRHVGLYVRGRLDVPTTLRLNSRGSPAVASVDRPKMYDNAVARSIVLADQELDRQIGRADWRGKRVEEIVTRLRAATGSNPELPSRRELQRVRFTPITLHYKRAGWLSWEIAQRRGLQSRATGERSEGLLIDVAELWELFVLHCARRAVGSAAVTHGTHLSTRRHLLRDESGERSLGRLYPDVLIGAKDAPTAIMDAKYKPLAGARGVDRQDLYQLTTYLMAHPGRPNGILAYPQLPGDPPSPYQEQHSPWYTPQGHSVWFIRLPITESACRDRLSALLSETR